MNILSSSHHHYRLKEYIFLFVGVVLVNLAFKIFFITDTSLWSDEICSVFYAQQGFPEIKNYATWDINPPFYHYLLHYWIKWFGIEAIAVRSFSLMMNVLTGGLLAVFARRYFNWTTTIIASILYLISNELFYYAFEARTYALNVFFVIVSYWLFFLLARKPKIIYALLLGVVYWMAINSHYLFAVLPFLHGLVLLIFRKWKPLGLITLSGAVVLALFNTWINRMIEVIIRGGNPNIFKQTDAAMFYERLATFFNHEYILWASIIVLLVFLYLLLTKKIKPENHDEVVFNSVFLAICSIGFMIVMYVLGKNSTTFFSRYLLFVTPGLYLLVGYAFSLLPLQKVGKVVAYVLLFASGLFTIDYNLSKPMDYKNAVAFVKQHQDDKTLVILQTRALSELFSYYYDVENFKRARMVPEYLMKHNVLAITEAVEMKQIDLSPYRQIIFLQTFFGDDPTPATHHYLKEMGTLHLSHKHFKWCEIDVYDNPSFDAAHITLAEELAQSNDRLVHITMEKIRNIDNWMAQIRSKAKERGISEDSMLYQDAVWYLNH